MKRWGCLLLVILLLFLRTSLSAQEEDFWQQWMEDWMELHEEEGSDDIAELLDEFRTNPILLNDTLHQTLLQLPFISPSQYESLKAYIRQNGQLYSYGELRLIRGFDSLTIRLLAPLTSLETVSPSQKMTFDDIIKRGRSQLVVGSKGTLEEAEGYQDNRYPGSPFRLYYRYQYKYGERISFQLSGDKDAGEQFLTGAQKQGFDHYGGHLIINELGRIKRAVIGQYQLQFGQGLTLWSGTSSWTSNTTTIWRYGQGIRPSSAFCEYGYLQGAAATIALSSRLELTPFLSIARRDATYDSTTDCISAFYSAGYHRTANEISKINQAREINWGANLHYFYNNLSLGVTAYHTHLNRSLQPYDYIYNSYAFSGKENNNLGMDASYRWNDLVLFGEAAISDGSYKDKDNLCSTPTPISYLVGFQLYVNDRDQLSGFYRHYASSYQNLHAAPLGLVGSQFGEKGFCLKYQTTLPFQIQSLLVADFFDFPWMRYRCYSPSIGSSYQWRLTKELSSGCSLNLLYRMRHSQRNCSETVYSVSDFYRHSLQLDWVYNPSDCWRLQSRVSYVWFIEEDGTCNKGFLLYQDVRYKAPRTPLSCSIRYTLFDVDNYDARIYTYENDLLYEYSSPAFQGEGFRFYFLAKYDISRHIVLGIKYDISQYTDRESIGSGADKINRSHKQEIKMQLRFKF